MTENQFEIRVLDLHWIDNSDGEKDLCAHGKVYLRINDEIVCDESNLDVTVSATALYLLRSLTENYKKNDFGCQLLPCCGFFTYFDENGRPEISGCPTGIDWTIEHLDSGLIKHISEGGKQAIISKEDYKNMVFDFADKVENFYKESKPKIIPSDDFDRGAYYEIWEEWKKLRHEQ